MLTMAIDHREGPRSALPYRYTAALASGIEKKWTERWDESQTYFTPNPIGGLAEPNSELAQRTPYVALDMFPYPSGSGLHVGHPLGYIGTDVLARYHRMRGFNVLHSMGYDAFGLPAERYALETGEHPEVTTRQNITNMRRQLRRLGLGHDPRRSVVTSDPRFYRWTQWIFLQIYNSWYDPEHDRARPISELVEGLDSGKRELPLEVSDGRPWSELSERERTRAVDDLRLAYLADVTVNWCPALGTVLANEEVTVDGLSEQGNFPVFRRPLRQWMMRITAYAERLIADLDNLDWSESLKTMQRNWIGRSEGVRVQFEGDHPSTEPLTVFTTRPDTIHGVTFIAVAPEHPLLDSALPAEYPAGTPAAWRGAGQDLEGGPPSGFDSPTEALARYRNYAEHRSDRQRQLDVGSGSGMYTGINVVHPLSGERVPVFVADFVLAQYGSGALMGVPAHDARDFRFAQALGIPIRVVVRPPANWLLERGLGPDTPAAEWPEAYTGVGESVNGNGPTDGRSSADASRMIVYDLTYRGKGAPERVYRLRDWLFSRQRYWGEPFPIVYDEHGDAVALPESHLPVELPPLEDFAPTESESEAGDPVPPLTRATDWVNVELDLGEGVRQYRRETNTMPQWAGSCWYYLRYLDPNNDRTFVDPAVERYWMSSSRQPGGVDLYVGGVEHAVLHLLYARFWHKVLFDLGHVSTPEPFQRLFNQGYVQAAAYTDERGFYVEAGQVEGRGGAWFYKGKQVQRSYGKMGKSLKNSVPPDEVIRAYGADALRLYEMFLGPLDQDRPWDTQGITGVFRFLQRVWRYVVSEETGESRVVDDELSEELQRSLNRTVAAVRRDIERLRFNTAIAALMELLNELRAASGDATPRQAAEWLVLALAPFAPHMCEELWQRMGQTDSIVYVPYPEPNPELVAASQTSIVVQVNGRVRGVVEVPVGSDDAALERAARAQPRAAKLLAGAGVERVVVVPGRLVNFVLSPYR